ncbi:MAG: hypothetical protein Q8P18_03770 [Pseudomonadota bacterium]|nr:hypothetical protein [Pseudomonadota bacterium]
MDIDEAFSPMRALRHGADALQRAPVGLLLGGFLLFVIDSCSGSGGGGDLSEITQRMDAAQARLLVSLVWISALLGIVMFVVRCWFVVGWIRLQRTVLETGADSVGLLFAGGDAFFRMLGWRLLNRLILLGTTAVAAIPGGALVALGSSQEIDAMASLGVVVMLLTVLPVVVYVWLGLALGDHAVALDGLGPVGALDRSWELARGHRLRIGVFVAVTDLFSALGLLACCIGYFVTRTIAEIGLTEAYVLTTIPGAGGWVVPREAV